MSPHFPPNNFDHSFPSSNASGVDDNTHLESWHSRPSSAPSNHPSPAIPSSPQPAFHTSPILSSDFANMSVNTPSWGTVPLPQHSSIIHVPNEDAYMMNGPQFCIVPATPVSGGGAGSTDVPFQTTSSTLTQGITHLICFSIGTDRRPSLSSESAPSINHEQSLQQQRLQRDPSPSTFTGTEENSAITSSSTHNNADLSATSGFIFPNNYSQPPPQQQHQSRPRTYSDPWNPNSFSSTRLENANVANEALAVVNPKKQHSQSFSNRHVTISNSQSECDDWTYGEGFPAATQTRCEFCVHRARLWIDIHSP